jgi:BON domain
MTMPQLMVGDPVDGRDGPLGTVAGTREVTAGQDEAGYILVELSRFFGLVHTTRLVPLAWVRDVPAPPEARRVTLDASRAQVMGCPPLRADADILADVAPALSMTLTGLFRVATLRATVRDGVVDLTGHSLSTSEAHAAILRTRHVPGVLAVQDHSV